MPLIKSKSKAAIGQNIAIETASGKPRKQAIAIALNVARTAGANIPSKQHGSQRATPKPKAKKLRMPKAGSPKQMAGHFRKFV